MAWGREQGGDTITTVEGPEQFLWRGRLWRVSEVLAHWVETGPWWRSRGVHAVLGADEPDQPDQPRLRVPTDLTAERDVWRVEADRGRGAGQGIDKGVFDLTFDWTDGGWRLTRCQD
ncbi:MAG: hypothetical protein HOQ22_11150 [Nocardioidaceae bacterium]|nr:hypothetical protein [Nocardioidaceae bacterium]NUS51583.1 hypothetical protein [Nocardioidaceae bacterium]